MGKPSVSGSCLLMCPLSEIQIRQRERLVHVLESSQATVNNCQRDKSQPVSADRHKMVKMFSRSAAGRDMLKPQDLRPPPVLKRTINYLLGNVVCNSQVPWSTVCSFVTDRLRSIKQDMVIQQPPPDVCCCILEPIVRFHAYSAYKLCEEPLDAFDPVLNNTHLNETLKQLLVCYDSIAKSSALDPDGALDQMEALYGILHLGNEDALLRMVSLTVPRNSLLSIALQMSLADYRNDYVTVCRLLKRLPALLACVAATHLPRIRRRALFVMNSAYSSKNLRYPVSQLQSTLMYEGNNDAAEECRYYGLTVEDNTNVNFLKGSFNTSVKDCKLKKLQFIDDSLAKLSLPEMLLTPS